MDSFGVILKVLRSLRFLPPPQYNGGELNLLVVLSVEKFH